MSSVYVICWIFLQTFQNYFCIQANNVDPDQTAPSLIWVHTVCKNDFKNQKQMAKQTIVVIGSLRVKYASLCSCVGQKFEIKILVFIFK